MSKKNRNKYLSLFPFMDGIKYYIDRLKSEQKDHQMLNNLKDIQKEIL